MFQKNLRSRVSYTFVKQLEATPTWDAATFYSYDILGNVDTLLQDYKTGAMAISGNRFNPDFADSLQNLPEGSDDASHV